MAARAPRKGFQDSFVHQSPEETEAVCPVCFNVLCEPKLAACCGHSVCAACIDQIERGEKSCPTCMCSQQMKLVDDKHLERELNGLTVYCPHKEKGYEWTGELGEVNNHHNKQPTTDNLLTGCQFQKIHCEACQSHQCQCQLMEHHVSSSCPERGMECEYQYIGCDFQGSQLVLDGHMSEAIGTHLSLLSKFVQSHLSQKDGEIKAIKGELKKCVPQQDSKVKEHLTQQGQVKVLKVQQYTEQSQQLQQLGTERIRQSKKHIVPCWILILCLFLVAGGVNAYLYQAWCSDCSCGRDLHEELLSDLYVKKIDLDRQVQQLDYSVAQIKTILQAKVDELKLAISKTTQVVEGVGNDLNVVKEILLRNQQEQSLAKKGYGKQKNTKVTTREEKKWEARTRG